jgi:hypothetical protein
MAAFDSRSIEGAAVADVTDDKTGLDRPDGRIDTSEPQWTQEEERKAKLK